MSRISKFQPKLYLDKIEDLDLNHLKELNYKNIFIDLDNTLAPFDQVNIDNKALTILNRFRDNGFFVVVISNNKGERVKKFLENTDYNWLNFALKPTKIGYKKLIKKYNLNVNETVMIGDQILTDIYGANRMGLYSILVKPLVLKDGFSTKINRRIEKYLINKGMVKLK